MLTGIREAVRALHLLRNDSLEAAAEAATMVSAEAHKPRKGVCCALAHSCSAIVCMSCHGMASFDMGHSRGCLLCC